MKDLRFYAKFWMKNTQNVDNKQDFNKKSFSHSQPVPIRLRLTCNHFKKQAEWKSEKNKLQVLNSRIFLMSDLKSHLNVNDRCIYTRIGSLNTG